MLSISFWPSAPVVIGSAASDSVADDLATSNFLGFGVLTVVFEAVIARPLP
jgi:hypothetical protein